MVDEQSQAASRALEASAKVTETVMAAYAAARSGVRDEIKDLLALEAAGIPRRELPEHLMTKGRLKILLRKIDADYLNYAGVADRATRRAIRVAAEEGFARYQYTLNFFSPASGAGAVKAGISFTALPLPLAEVIVDGTYKSWDSLKEKVQAKIERTFGSLKAYYPHEHTLSWLLAKNRDLTLKGINVAVTGGILQGKGAESIAEKVADVIGDSTRGAGYRALRIARTETLRAMNAGAYAAMQQVRDPEAAGQKKIWIASLDLRTRESHQKLDGQMIGMDENFSGTSGSGLRPGAMGAASENINCRCRSAAIFDGVPPETRRGRNPLTGESELFKWTSYDEWKRQGTEAIAAAKAAML